MYKYIFLSSIILAAVGVVTKLNGMKIVGDIFLVAGTILWITFLVIVVKSAMKGENPSLHSENKH